MSASRARVDNADHDETLIGDDPGRLAHSSLDQQDASRQRRNDVQRCRRLPARATHGPAPRSRRGPRSRAAMNPSPEESEGLAQFVQICASQNDLFALDGEGNVYKFNFNASTWEKLAARRSREEPKRGEQTRPADGERSSRRV